MFIFIFSGLEPLSIKQVNCSALAVPTFIPNFQRKYYHLVIICLIETNAYRDFAFKVVTLSLTIALIADQKVWLHEKAIRKKSFPAAELKTEKTKRKTALGVSAIFINVHFPCASSWTEFESQVGPIL